jgi:hypothetical protein
MYLIYYIYTNLYYLFLFYIIKFYIQGEKQSRNAHLYTLWLRTDHVTWFCGHRFIESWLCCVAEYLFVCITIHVIQTNKYLNLNINNEPRRRQHLQRNEDGDEGGW